MLSSVAYTFQPPVTSESLRRRIVFSVNSTGRELARMLRSSAVAATSANALARVLPVHRHRHTAYPWFPNRFAKSPSTSLDRCLFGRPRVTDSSWPSLSCAHIILRRFRWNNILPRILLRHLPTFSVTLRFLKKSCLIRDLILCLLSCRFSWTTLALIRSAPVRTIHRQTGIANVLMALWSPCFARSLRSSPILRTLLFRGFCSPTAKLR